MPCPRFYSEVAVQLHRVRDGELVVHPAGKAKARRAAALTLAEVGADDTGATVFVSSQIPPCRGYGSSTADVTATINAVSAACGRRLPVRRVAELAARAEGATDATPWRRPVLFAQREGLLVESFAPAWPRMSVVAFDASCGATGVDTLELAPAHYDDAELDELECLRAMLRDALARRDVAGVGAVATASARINQRHLPIAGFEDLAALGSACGAAGMQISHSGDVAGFIFAPGPASAAGTERAYRELEAMSLRPWTYATAAA